MCDRHPLVELVDGLLMVCGEQRECWTYSHSNDSWTPAQSLLQQVRQKWETSPKKIAKVCKMKQEIFDENRSSATVWPCFTFNVTQRVRSSSSSVGGKMMVTGGYLPSQGTMSTTEVWTRRRGWRRGVPLSPGEGRWPDRFIL